MEKEVLELALETLRFAAQTVQYLAAPAVAFAFWTIRKMRSDQAKVSERLQGLETDQKALAKDQEALKKCVDEQPGGADLAEMKGDLKAVKSIVERVESMVNRHEDHLLNRGGK